MNIKVKEIELRTDQLYLSSEYPYSGIFIVKDDIGSKFLSVVSDGMVTTSIITLNLQDWLSNNSIEEVKSSTGSVSEDFALKMLSIAHGNDNHMKL